MDFNCSNGGSWHYNIYNPVGSTTSSHYYSRHASQAVTIRPDRISAFKTSLIERTSILGSNMDILAIYSALRSSLFWRAICWRRFLVNLSRWTLRQIVEIWTHVHLHHSTVTVAHWDMFRAYLSLTRGQLFAQIRLAIALAHVFVLLISHHQLQLLGRSTYLSTDHFDINSMSATSAQLIPRIGITTQLFSAGLPNMS